MISLQVERYDGGQQQRNISRKKKEKKKKKKKGRPFSPLLIFLSFQKRRAGRNIPQPETSMKERAFYPPNDRPFSYFNSIQFNSML